MKFETYICKSGVLFFLSIPPPFGGGEIVNQFLLRYIKDKYNVVTLSRNYHNKSLQGKINLRNVADGIWKMIVHAYYILRLKPKVVFLGIPKDFSSFIRMSFELYLAKMMGCKVIGDLHGMNFTFSAGQSSLYRKTINKFNVIRVLGQDIKKTVAGTGYQNDISVIDNGIEVPAFVQNHASPFLGDKIKLLYLGAISESKGFGRTLEIFRALHLKYPARVELNIAGEFVDPVSGDKFREISADQELASQIHYHKRVLNEEKWNLLLSSNLLLHFTQYDGQPLTIIEAMACGVPTIATKIGAIPEMITHNENGFLVDNCLADSMKYIGDILDGVISYELVSRNAKKTFFERFTAEVYAGNIEKLVSIT